MMHSVSFRFGNAQQHELKLDNYLLGTEKYDVDGELVLTSWSLNPRSTRELSAAGHRITIRTTVNLKRVQMDGDVDGQLVAPDLAAEFNRKMLERRARRPKHTLVTLIAWIVLTTVLTYMFLAIQHAR